MAVVVLGPPAVVEATLSIPQGVALELPLNWVDNLGATVPMSTWHASLAFSAGGTGEIVPVTVTDLTSAVTVGRITLADASPNMLIVIPAVVTAALSYRRLRGVLDVTDASGTPRRWMEADVTLDRGVGF